MALALAALAALAPATSFAESWEDHAIAPVTNPIFFESPLIQSEVRPLFVYHTMDNDFLGLNADTDVQVYALQLRWAINDRWAIIATKDGYMTINSDSPVLDNREGWNDIAAGVKYAAVKDEEKQLIVTPGVTFEIPTGNSEVFQGNASGEFNVFTSAVKGWGDFHLTGNIGFRVPINWDKETVNFRACAMLDYFVCKWFIPFVSFNSFTTISDADAAPFDSEGFDVINFGATNANGVFQAAVGGGFRSRIVSSVDFGFAYEYGFSPDDDIFKDRFTVDVIWRF